MIKEYEVITSRKNAAVARAYSLLDKKSREKQKLFRFDGVKLFTEAVSAGIEIEIIFIKESEKDKITETVSDTFSRTKRDFSCRVMILADFVFEKITEEKGSQGIVCVAKYIDTLHKRMKKEDHPLLCAAESRKVMALSSVRDPGNIGTLLRSAAAFGIDTLLFSSDCADVYNPKTVRAAMGALFRQKIYIADDLASAVTALRESGRRVFAAEPDSSAQPITSIGLRADDCIIIGNEGHGIAADVLSACTGSVYIPISSTTESLNASIAGAICMWEMSKL